MWIVAFSFYLFGLTLSSLFRSHPNFYYRAIKLLERLYERRKNEWVFVNDDGERLSYEALRYQTRIACQEAGIEYRGEHVFRHTFATNCYHKGVDVKILSRLLGHADVNITYNLYIHLYGDGFDEMYTALTRHV